MDFSSQYSAIELGVTGSTRLYTIDSAGYLWRYDIEIGSTGTKATNLTQEYSLTLAQPNSPLTAIMVREVSYSSGSRGPRSNTYFCRLLLKIQYAFIIQIKKGISQMHNSTGSNCGQVVFSRPTVSQ